MKGSRRFLFWQDYTLRWERKRGGCNPEGKEEEEEGQKNWWGASRRPERWRAVGLLLGCLGSGVLFSLVGFGHDGLDGAATQW